MTDNQNENDGTSPDLESHRFTPADMAGALLLNGLSATAIEDRIAAPSGSVQDWLRDEHELTENISPELNRLKILYLQEQVKSVLRHSPFIGIQKGANRIGINRKSFEFIYRSLISSGEVTYSLEIPTWLEHDKRVPMRKHYVK